MEIILSIKSKMGGKTKQNKKPLLDKSIWSWSWSRVNLLSFDDLWVEEGWVLISTACNVMHFNAFSIMFKINDSSRTRGSLSKRACGFLIIRWWPMEMCVHCDELSGVQIKRKCLKDELQSPLAWGLHPSLRSTIFLVWQICQRSLSGF